MENGTKIIDAPVIQLAPAKKNKFSSDSPPVQEKGDGENNMNAINVSDHKPGSNAGLNVSLIKKMEIIVQF